MSNFDHINVFVAVVEHDGFAAAGRHLGVAKSTISRKVAELEERLGVRLLNRTTRQISTTDIGERFYGEAKIGIDALLRAERVAERALDEPRGTLRITSIANVAALDMGGLIDRYLRAYPETSIEFRADARTVDLVAEGFDVALRAGPMQDSTLMTRVLRTVDAILCAAPDYLESRGRPERPSDLKDHPCILLGTERLARGDQWRLTRGASEETVSVGGRVRVNDPASAHPLCVRGHGIAVLPEIVVRDDLQSGRLEHVLPDWSGGTLHLQAVFQGSKLLDPKTRAFVDMAMEHFEGF